MKSKESGSTENHRLARLFSLDETNEGEWEPQEIGAIFRHQWNAPFSKPKPSFADRDGQRQRESENPSRPSSLAELIAAKSPPLDLLIEVKNWAKQLINAPNPPLPREVASVIYYTTILAALCRLQESISTLDPESLIEAAEWLNKLPWIDDAARSLAAETLNRWSH